MSSSRGILCLADGSGRSVDFTKPFYRPSNEAKEPGDWLVGSLLHKDLSVLGDRNECASGYCQMPLPEKAFGVGVIQEINCFSSRRTGFMEPHKQVWKRHCRCLCFKLFKLTSESFCPFSLPRVLPYPALGWCGESALLHYSLGAHSQFN